MSKKYRRFAAALLAFALVACLFAVPSHAAGEQDIETMFKGYNKGGSLARLRLRLEGDTVIFDYSPSIFVTRDYPGYEPLTDADVDGIIQDCVAGLKAWEGTYQVCGRELTFVVNVHPTRAERKAGSSIRVLPPDSNGFGGIANFSVLVWTPRTPTYITIRYRPGDRLASTVTHEFGHALGLNDAYGYSFRDDGIFRLIPLWLMEMIQPDAPEDRAPPDALMRGSWRGAVIYDRDVEMVLWAWKHGKFQLYADSLLRYLFFFEVSPAFSH